MRSWIKVARYHLVVPVYVWAAWAVLAFVFLINLLITAVQGGPNPTKAFAAIFAVFFFMGVFSISRSMPFGLALGVSRRSYILGTALLNITLAALYGLIIAGLQAIERATHGWGVQMHFFQVAYLFVGPWYLTWATAFVGLVLMFAYGMCFGIVYRRWDLPGLTIFVVVQAGALLAGGLIIAAHTHGWRSVGHFFTDLGAAGLTGVLAALAVVVLAAGYGVARRITV
jgi:hypothetical protein